MGLLAFLNDIVRNNTLSPARVANALDAGKVYSATGTDTYAVTVGLGLTGYNTGDTYRVKIVNTNATTTPTLNVTGASALGAKSIKDNAGNALAAGDLKANGVYDFVYDGTNLRVMNIGGSSGGGTWGSITGTLSSQTDLQTTLDAKQDEDATLTALAGLATGANKIPYSTGTDTFSQLDFKDEDDMVSNSATAIPSQQSVKAYFDNNALGYTPVDELTKIAGLSLETDITAAQLLTALGIITYVPIHADAVTGVTLTDHPNSVQAFGNDSKSYCKIDSRLLSAMRLSARVFTTSASVNNPRLYIQYSTNGGSSYTTLGAGTIASGDAISLFTGATTIQNTNWITLPSDAKANDLIWRIVQDGGNGSADPVVGNVFIQCKY